METTDREDELDFPCLFEDDCQYPYCDCEAAYLESYIEELPDVFNRMNKEGIDDDTFFNQDGYRD